MRASCNFDVEVRLVPAIGDALVRVRGPEKHRLLISAADRLILSYLTARTLPILIVADVLRQKNNLMIATKTHVMSSIHRATVMPS
jgi:hypothetical protein